MSVLPSTHALWLAGLHRLDWFRHAPGGKPPGGAFTEWAHFCVLGSDVRLLVNLSLHAAPGERLTPRLLVAAHAGSWRADLQTFRMSDVDMRAGRFDAVVGGSTLSIRPDGYHLHVHSTELGLQADLRLVPSAQLLLAPNAALPGRGTLSWLASPRLAATGTLRLGGHTHTLLNTPAYHDRNWGRFDWAGDVAWEWGFALPEQESRTSLLFLRMTDRARSRVLRQGVWLWRDGQLAHGFREHCVSFRPTGFRRAAHIPVVPRQLESAFSGTASGVPRRLAWTAVDGENELHAELEPGDPLRIIAPGTGGLAVVHESCGRMRVHGKVLGEPVSWTGAAVLEVLNG